MVITTTELSLIVPGTKGGADGLHALGGTSAGVLCYRTFSAPWLRSPLMTAASRSRFSTSVLTRRNYSSLGSRDGEAGFSGAVCTIGSNFPIRGSWGFKVTPATHHLPSLTQLMYVFLIASMMLWKMVHKKRMKSLLAFSLLGLCIVLGILASKGNEKAIFLVTIFDKSGKVYKLLGHVFNILERLL